MISPIFHASPIHLKKVFRVKIGWVDFVYLLIPRDFRVNNFINLRIPFTQIKALAKFRFCKFIFYYNTDSTTSITHNVH